MSGQDKGYEVIRGEGKVEPDRAEEILKKLLGSADIKNKPFKRDPGFVVPPHYHTENLAAYVLAGRVQIKTGNDLSNTMEFLPGDAFLMKKGTIHREEIVSDVPCEMAGAYVKDFETVQVDLEP